MKIDRDWTFENKDVAKNFDVHVREQLPWYDLATDAISAISRNFISDNAVIYDIGCSTGNIGNALSKTIQNKKATLISIESSKEMIKQYHGIQKENLLNKDACEFDFEKFNLSILFLTCMFIDPEKRVNFIKYLKSMTKKGGAIILFDKFIPLDGYYSTVYNRLTIAGKLSANATPSNIIAKELSLSGVQIPMNINEIKGFKEWFRFGDFAGYIYINI